MSTNNENRQVAVYDPSLYIKPVQGQLSVGDVVADTDEEKAELIRSVVRNKIMRQYGVIEMNGVAVTNKDLMLNNVKKGLKLPAVKTKADGNYAETPEEFFTRIKPTLKTWLLQVGYTGAFSWTRTNAIAVASAEGAVEVEEVVAEEVA